MTWRTIGDVAFYVATAVTISFALLYLNLAPWWRTSAGRNIMAVMGSMAVAFGYFSWAIANGGVPAGFEMMRALIFIGIALAVGWRIVIFIRHQVILPRRAEKERSNELEDAR